jgi:hypothetical protein
MVKPIRYNFQEMFIYDPTCCGPTAILINYGDAAGIYTTVTY